MPRIIEPGVALADIKPWYTTQSFSCPVCTCVFTLDESDVATTTRQRRLFTLTIAPEASGNTTLVGNCPSCQSGITFQRPNLVAPGVEYPLYAHVTLPDAP